MNRREFAKISSITALYLPVRKISGKLIVSKEDALKSKAVRAFKRFQEVWDFNDFWKRGNT